VQAPIGRVRLNISRAFVRPTENHGCFSVYRNRERIDNLQPTGFWAGSKKAAARLGLRPTLQVRTPQEGHLPDSRIWIQRFHSLVFRDHQAHPSSLAPLNPKLVLFAIKWLYFF